MAERDNAQQKRTDARRRRREAAKKEPSAETASAEPQGETAGGDDEPIETVKHAAKVAAAAAAVGAAVGAARAITGKEDDEPDEGGDGAREAVPETRDQSAAGTESGDEQKEQPEQREQPQASRPEPQEDEEQEQERQSATEPQRNAEGRTDDHRSLSGGRAQRAVQQAREHLKTLAGLEAESVSSFTPAPDGGGWKIGLEVLEVSRVPPSTDVLATYEVTLDDNGDLLSYTRTRRYYRSQASEDDR
jgi:Gas vesicle synthesis protein GvpO